MTPGSRSFLFLQGPPGPFFAQLGSGLRAMGHRVARINCNGGDWLDWPGPAENFTGGQESWTHFLDTLFGREAVTDLVVFGDCRPLHRIACDSARARGIIVHVFEEGYIRPDWVTLERGGVNGHSSLPRLPAEFLALASGLSPIPVYPPIPARFRTRAAEAARYYCATWTLAFRFPGYRSHRPFPVSAEFLGWLYRSLTRPLARLRSAIAMRRLGSQRYFVLPLQLDSDHQIRTHSHFAGMAEVVQTVIVSFAAHAPPESVLVVKEHPLDNGLRPWRLLVRRAARRHGVGNRILYIEHGAIDALVAASQGVVTVNSTTGTFALAAGTPVVVLGRAVYDIAGVTHQGGLDPFWTAPAMPQVEIYDAFRRVVVTRCLLRGGFSSTAGRAHLLPAAIERLCRPRLLADAQAGPARDRAIA